jgi:hypothetical protein
MVAGFTTTCAISAYHPKVVSWNPVHCKVYSIQLYVIKFVSDLRQGGGFLRVLWFVSSIKISDSSFITDPLFANFMMIVCTCCIHYVDFCNFMYMMPFYVLRKTSEALGTHHLQATVTMWFLNIWDNVPT